MQPPAPRPVQDAHDIRKAQQAIAVLPTNGSRITLLMRRFWNVLLHHAQQAGEAETYKVALSDILNGGEFTSGDVELAKATLRSMTKTTVEWNFIGPDSDDQSGSINHWGISGLLADAEIYTLKNRTYLEYSFSPKIRRHLLDPARYVQLSLHAFASLGSSTAAALYEVCKRYITNANGLTNKAEWEWWRPRLTGISNEDSDQTSLYKYFKRDTLWPAILEINANTDIDVELLEFKTGRKITHIQFASKLKAQSALDYSESQPIVDTGIMNRILALGVDQKAAIRLYASRDEDAIKATLDYVEARMQRGDLASPAALFVDALKKGYGRQEGQRLKRPARPAAPAKPILPGLMNVQLEADKRTQKINDFLDALPLNEREAIEARFVASLSGQVLIQFRRHGFRSKVVKADLVAYCAAQGYPDHYSPTGS